MNPDEIRKLFPHATKSLLAANAQDSRPVAKLEPNPKPRTLGSSKAEALDTGRILVRVTSVRKRLLDEDNLCEKYHVDCLRYSGLLLTDAPEAVQIITTQRKCEKGEEEHTLIEISDAREALNLKN